MKFVIVAVALVLLVALIWGRSGRAKRNDGAAPRRGAKTSSGAPEAMVSCAHCGVHLPASDAVLLGERAYCSPAHRDAGPRPPAG
jgi:uncharacterized protein